MLGTVVASSSPAVAARCAWAQAGAGAVATQNVTDPALAPRVLGLLASGRSAEGALAGVMATAPHAEYRQLAVIDAHGRTASYSGRRMLGRHGSRRGTDCVAAGNLLGTADVITAMTAAFEQRPQDHLASRLLGALRAGAAAGGEAGPVHSSGLVVVDKVTWPVTDLRADWHDDPVGELARLWAIWQPQEAGYLQRALDPAAAPAYRVPGDE
jgi:uncharacterized Ntn-hydrolase superfamily protein